MSNAARRHYAAREGAAPTPADARREAVTQPTTPAPAGAVHAEDFRPRVTGAMAASIELDDDPFPDFDPETMSGADAAALAREPYDPETMAFGRRTRGPFARLED